MDVVYLDYNCFQRSFDDPSQPRIQMEAMACREIFHRAEASAITLVWSFIHQDETMLCPFVERRLEALRLANLCRIRVGPDQVLLESARNLEASSLSAKDALHVACAVSAKATHFLTCDDRLMAAGQRLALGLSVQNPIDYVMRGSAS